MHDAGADVPLIVLPKVDAGRDATRDSGPPLPPKICNAPVVPAGAWFSEITTPSGLGTETAPTYLGSILYAADLDGDGYSDVLGTSDGTSTRATMGTVHHSLLMNRPDPTDPTKRVFVNTYYATSGIDATADGAGGRGFTIALIGDLDNDGDNDLITCPGVATRGSTRAPRAAERWHRAPCVPAPASALNALASTDYEGGTLLDFDSDGVLDFWAGPRSGDGGPPFYPPALMKGNGDGTFTNVSGAMGLPTVSGTLATSASFRQTLGVTACDLDGDGDPRRPPSPTTGASTIRSGGTTARNSPRSAWRARARE